MFTKRLGLRAAAAVVFLAGVSVFARIPGAAAGPVAGRVIGTVRLTSAQGRTSHASAYTRRAAGLRHTRRPPEMRSVVVFLSGAHPASAPPAQRAVLSQKGEQFEPHVVAVTTGSVVEFPNDDPFFHNVFSLSEHATFDLGRYPPGESRNARFASPGIVKVFCHIHSRMSAIVRVFDHPWFTIPAEEGAFSIEGVPAGTYTAVAWHERIGEQRTKVTIAPGETVSVDFTLPVLEAEP